MKKIAFILMAIALSFNANAQKNGKSETKPNSFKYPVLVKMIHGSGNIFRIGFLRHNDFHGIEESVGENIYASFINLVDVSKGDFKDKYFVYFPLANQNGEMLIVDRREVTKLDLTYEQAMELIVVDNGN